MELLEKRRRAQSPAAPPVIPATVLIVDDEAAIREVTQCVLQHRGINTLLAANGAEALQLFRERSAEIAVVLTDIHMPGLSGLEFIRALRREPRPPIIAVMCGRLDPLLHRSLAAEGVLSVLEKPFQLEELEAIFALLPAHTAAAPASPPC